MMQVRQVLIMSAHNGAIAYLDSEGWHDPHGGTFSDRDVAALVAFATGEIDAPITNVGTKYERTHDGARVVVHF